MNNNDTTSKCIMLFAASIFLIPVAIILYIMLKKKATISINSMYLLEKDLVTYYEHYINKKSLFEHNKTVVERNKEDLYSQFEILDDLEVSIFLIKDKMGDFDNHYKFVKNLSVMKIQDTILEKDYSKYRFNYSDELSNINHIKKKIYKKFESLNA